MPRGLLHRGCERRFCYTHWWTHLLSCILPGGKKTPLIWGVQTSWNRSWEDNSVIAWEKNSFLCRGRERMGMDFSMVPQGPCCEQFLRPPFLGGKSLWFSLSPNHRCGNNDSPAQPTHLSEAQPGPGERCGLGTPTLAQRAGESSLAGAPTGSCLSPDSPSEEEGPMTNRLGP